MDNVQRLKLSNDIGIRILKNDFPINGTTTIKITMTNNQPVSVEVKNSNRKEK